MRIRNNLVAQYFPELDRFWNKAKAENLAIVRLFLDPASIRQPWKANWGASSTSFPSTEDATNIRGFTKYSFRLLSVSGDVDAPVFKRFISQPVQGYWRQRLPRPDKPLGLRPTG